MNRIENFSAELVSPELFREICSLMSTVGKVCTISTRRPSDESEGEDEELVMCAVNSANSFQMWVHLLSKTMFQDFQLTNPEWVEVKSDSLAHAFRNEAGIMSMSEVKMKITHKPTRQHSTHGGTGSQVVPQNSRLISFTMNNKSIDALATKAIEQRLYAELVEHDVALAEPSLAGIKFWGDPTIEQLNQMAKVCDQYKQMNDTVRVTVSKSGLLTLVSSANDCVANTSWRIDLAERADEPEESLFVEEAPIQRSRTEESCVVLAKDWYTVLQSRRMCRRLVIGVLDQGGVVVYGFLKQGRNLSTQDVATFYLWHQGP